ncbi:hypothetical protein DFH06DRAFT_691200 [Mycena polygramma]|nr:hypothetical protein DFH06DRAFT_691200 [Mycena polygramma]
MAPVSSSRESRATRASLCRSRSRIEESEVADSEPERQSGADDSDHEVHEIEAILDARKDLFPNNKLGYFVKWKGYGPEDNSWVIEDEATTTAADMIKAFWDVKNSADSPKNIAQPQKRGRKPASAKNEEKPQNPDHSVASESSGAGAETWLEDDDFGNMAEHMHVPTWDQLIKSIDTVERVDETLYVHFTLNGGERIREESKLCADKCPKMLINFYESHLHLT